MYIYLKKASLTILFYCLCYISSIGIKYKIVSQLKPKNWSVILMWFNEHEVVLPQEWPGVVVDICLVDLGHGKSKDQPNPCSDMSQLQLDMHRMRRPNALSWWHPVGHTSLCEMSACLWQSLISCRDDPFEWPHPGSTRRYEGCECTPPLAAACWGLSQSDSCTCPPLMTRQQPRPWWLSSCGFLPLPPRHQMGLSRDASQRSCTQGWNQGRWGHWRYQRRALCFYTERRIRLSTGWNGRWSSPASDAGAPLPLWWNAGQHDDHARHLETPVSKTRLSLRDTLGIWNKHEQPILNMAWIKKLKVHIDKYTIQSNTIL